MAWGFFLRGKVFSAFTVLTVAVLGLELTPGGAAAETTSAILPVRQCAELVRDFDIPRAATHVTAARMVAAAASEPEHCDVRGYVDPAVRFQLRLPTATFMGRYVQYGCGGFCGMISPTPFPDCGGPHGGDLAVAVTNDGHVGELPVVDGGQTRGSELAWDGWLIPPPGGGASTASLLADIYLKHVGYPLGTPHSSVADFEFTIHEFDRLRPEARKGNAMSLDLETFWRSGGKLIIWHGWDDQAIPATGTLDYYQRLRQRSGGQRDTQAWARVFDDASNFVPAAPLLPPHDTIRWIGTDLYTKPGPAAP